MALTLCRPPCVDQLIAIAEGLKETSRRSTQWVEAIERIPNQYAVQRLSQRLVDGLNQLEALHASLHDLMRRCRNGDTTVNPQIDRLLRIIHHDIPVETRDLEQDIANNLPRNMGSEAMNGVIYEHPNVLQDPHFLERKDEVASFFENYSGNLPQWLRDLYAPIREQIRTGAYDLDFPRQVENLWAELQQLPPYEHVAHAPPDYNPLGKRRRSRSQSQPQSDHTAQRRKIGSPAPMYTAPPLGKRHRNTSSPKSEHTTQKRRIKSSSSVYYTPLQSPTQLLSRV